jgi:hypothetical protein
MVQGKILAISHTELQFNVNVTSIGISLDGDYIRYNQEKNFRLTNEILRTINWHSATLVSCSYTHLNLKLSQHSKQVTQAIVAMQLGAPITLENILQKLLLPYCENNIP